MEEAGGHAAKENRTGTERKNDMTSLTCGISNTKKHRIENGNQGWGDGRKWGDAAQRGKVG